MEKSDGSLPTYEESITAPLSTAGSKVPTGQRILDNITVSRSQNISHAASQHVIPEVERRARDGLANTVIVLLPSDVIPSEPESSEYSFGDAPPKIEMVGFSEDEEILDVQLDGTVNRSQFWKQHGVIDDFQRLLKDRLSTSLCFAGASQPPTAEPTGQGQTKSQKKALFARFSSSTSNGKKPATQSEMMQEPLKIDVRLEEICLRTTSSFGLYETVNRQAILVRVNVRC